MEAEIEVWWLNPITYRTEIRSAAFRQTRIVNGRVVEEKNTGSFYPRWIQNFVDALFEPVPHAEKLRREPGSIPVSQLAHACISHPAGARDESSGAEICFQGEQPLLASGISFSRYVAFDNFAAFGNQLIPRTLINDLPGNALVRGRIFVLEPLRREAYPLLKAMRLTPQGQQIRTRLLSKADAEALLDADSAAPAGRLHAGQKTLISYPMRGGETRADAGRASGGGDPVTVYIRTDKTGRVREAYTDRNDVYNRHQGAVARAMQLRFRPLIVDGAAQQIEAPVEIR